MKQDQIKQEDNSAMDSKMTVKKEPITEDGLDDSDGEEIIPKAEPKSDNPNEQIPLFVCQICFKSYPNKRAFNDHQKAHKPATIKCKICHKLFKENSLLAKHVKMVHESPYKPPVNPEERYCKQCDKLFPTRALLTKHSKQRHGERSSTCSLCPMTFLLKHHVKRHEELVHKIGVQKQVKEPDLVLDSVGQTDSSSNSATQDYSSTMVKRELIIQDVLDPADVECNSEVEPQVELQPRPKRVAKKSSTKCEICQKVLSTKTQLRLHVERMHTDRQNRKRVGWNLKYHPDENGLFHCHDCGKSFTSRAQISGHVMKHKSLQERKYYCEPCDKPFTTKDNLKIHNKRIHRLHRKKTVEESKDHSKIINIKHEPDAKQQDEGDSQLLEISSEAWHCEECGKSFQTGSSYKVHIKKHNSPQVTETCEEDENGLWTCSECGKVFDNKKFYQSHKRRHDAKKQGWYKCKYCDKHCGSKPDLERHEQVHVDGSGPRVTKYIRGENGLFNCEECDKSFESRNQFCSHVLMHKYVRERRFVCEPCDKAFGTRYALGRHEKDVHGKTANVQKAEKDQKL